MNVTVEYVLGDVAYVAKFKNAGWTIGPDTGRLRVHEYLNNDMLIMLFQRDSWVSVRRDSGDRVPYVINRVDV